VEALASGGLHEAHQPEVLEERARFLDAAREEYWRRNGRDIEKVSDLLAGPNPVLKHLPRAQLHIDGFEWILDPDSGQIVSSYYRTRYQLHETAGDRARKQRWREQADGAEKRADAAEREGA